MLEDRTSFSLRPHSLQIGLDVARNSISAHKDQRQTNGGGGATTIGKTIRQIKFLSSCKREREREREREKVEFSRVTSDLVASHCDLVASYNDLVASYNDLVASSVFLSTF